MALPLEPDENGAAVWLIAPNGMRVLTTDFFPCPEEIIVGPTGISFDGWVMRLDRGLTESSMAWLIRQTMHLSDSIGEDRTMAILDHIEASLSSSRTLEATERDGR